MCGQGHALGRTPPPVSRVVRGVNTIRESLSTARHNLEIRRTARQKHRQLVREVSQMYSTPTGRSEIDAIMRRHTTEEVAELDWILGSQLSH
jgi:hypothetical protein